MPDVLSVHLKAQDVSKSYWRQSSTEYTVETWARPGGINIISDLVPDVVQALLNIIEKDDLQNVPVLNVLSVFFPSRADRYIALIGVRAIEIVHTRTPN